MTNANLAGDPGLRQAFAGMTTKAALSIFTVLLSADAVVANANRRAHLI